VSVDPDHDVSAADPSFGASADASTEALGEGFMPDEQAIAHNAQVATEPTIALVR